MDKTPTTNTLEKFTDEEVNTLVQGLEEQYPQFNRLPKYKLIGFEPKSGVPIWMATWHDNSRYPIEKLRELRAERGVGRPPKKKVVDIGTESV